MKSADASVGRRIHLGSVSRGAGMRRCGAVPAGGKQQEAMRPGYWSKLVRKHVAFYTFSDDAVLIERDQAHEASPDHAGSHHPAGTDPTRGRPSSQVTSGSEFTAPPPVALHSSRRARCPERSSWVTNPTHISRYSETGTCTPRRPVRGFYACQRRRASTAAHDSETSTQRDSQRILALCPDASVFQYVARHGTSRSQLAETPGSGVMPTIGRARR